jgi:hypothetical protein
VGGYLNTALDASMLKPSIPCSWHELEAGQHPNHMEDEAYDEEDATAFVTLVSYLSSYVPQSSFLWI